MSDTANTLALLVFAEVYDDDGAPTNMVGEDDLGAWLTSGTPVVTDDQDSPDGCTGAFLVADTAAGDIGQIYQTISGLPADGQYVVVAAIKDAGGATGSAVNRIRVRDPVAGTNSLVADITWSAGVAVVDATTGEYIGRRHWKDDGWHVVALRTESLLSSNSQRLEVTPAAGPAAETGSMYVYRVNFLDANVADLRAAELLPVGADRVAARRVLGYSDRGYTTPATGGTPNRHLPGKVLRSGAIVSNLVDTGRTTGRSQVSYGELELANGSPSVGDAGDLDDFIGYAFDTRCVEAWLAEPGDRVPEDATLLFRGTQKPPLVERTKVRLRLADLQADLDEPFQDTLYAGDNVGEDGLEGNEDLAESPKPWAFGNVYNARPLLVNPARLIYQLHDGEINEITKLRAGGVNLGQTPFKWNEAAAYDSGANITPHGAHYDDTYGIWSVVGNAGSNVPLVRTSTDRATWSDATNSHSQAILGSHRDPATGRIFLVDNDYRGSYSDDGGVTWSSLVTIPSTLSSLFLRGVTRMLGEGNWIAVGSDNGSGGLAYASNPTTSGGWTAVTPVVGNQLFDVDNDGERAIAVGENGVWCYSDDGGVSWAAGTVFGGSFNRSIHHHNGTWLVAGNSGLFRSTDRGATWGRVFDAPASGDGAENFLLFQRAWYSAVLGRWIAIGRYVESSADVPVVYASEDDGRTWLPAEVDMTVTDAALYEVAEDTAAEEVAVFGAQGETAEPQAAGTFATLAELEDDALEPDPGTYKMYSGTEGAYVRLGSQPANPITLDFTVGATAAARTAGQGIVAALEKAGRGGSYDTADIATLDSANGAEVGLYLDEETTLSDVIEMFSRTVGAWWGADRANVIRAKRITEPASASPGTTLTDSDFVGRVLERAPANDARGGLPFYRVEVRYRRNFFPQSSNDLAAAVPEEDQVAFGSPYRVVVAEDTTTLVKHPRAPKLVVDSLFANEADAIAEASRLLTLRGAERDRYTAQVPLSKEFALVGKGDEVIIGHPRYGLDAGQNFLVTGVEPRPSDRTVRLQFWG